MVLKTKSEQIELVQYSFHEVLVEGEAFVARFYATMFDMFPETRQYFLKTDLTQLRKKVLRSLVMIIDNLHKPEILADEIRELGQKHTYEYYITRNDYTKMGRAFVKTLAASLPETWTPEVETAWVSAFADVAHLMLSES
jgi:hemoglobin-like flavoprotein